MFDTERTRSYKMAVTGPSQWESCITQPLLYLRRTTTFEMQYIRFPLLYCIEEDQDEYLKINMSIGESYSFWFFPDSGSFFQLS